MLNLVRNHPYITGFLIAFVIMSLVGIFFLDVTLTESLFGSAVLSAVGVLGVWWKYEGLG